MAVDHSPLPWELMTLNGRVPAVREVRQPFGEASRYESSVRSMSGEHVCKLDFGYGRACDEANAVFIVRACNNHEALLAALKLAEEFAHWWMRDNTEPRELDALKQIEQAIAKAEAH